MEKTQGDRRKEKSIEKRRKRRERKRKEALGIVENPEEESPMKKRKIETPAPGNKINILSCVVYITFILSVCLN